MIVKEDQVPEAGCQVNHGRLIKDQAPDTGPPIRDPIRIRSSGEETGLNRMISVIPCSLLIGLKILRVLPRSY